jgi:hypothetical protein
MSIAALIAILDLNQRPSNGPALLEKATLR